MLAQLVEHVTFNDVADGSNPSQDTILDTDAVVVQLVRIPACHAGGRGFEPHPPRHFVFIWALSSVGRALPLQGRCHWFESSSAHHVNPLLMKVTLSSSGQGHYHFMVVTEVQIL